MKQVISSNSKNTALKKTGYQLDVLVPSHIVWWNVYFLVEATFSLVHVPPGVTFEVRPLPPVLPSLHAC